MVVTPAERNERMRAHYRDRFAVHGPTPHGVDWNGEDSQRLQFEQLLKLLPANGSFSLNDFGCGYGALADLLVDDVRIERYRGYDLNVEMIDAARVRHAGRIGYAFEVADEPIETADYGVASGVFTLRLGRSDAQCAADLAASLEALDRTSRAGFAFNGLTSYSDAEKMRDYLWYPDPCAVFDLCKRRFSRDVALLHDYGLYAFTMLVRKERP